MNQDLFIESLKTNMNLYTINYIKNHPNIYRFLREESYWYKYLNRSSSYLKPLEEQMKKKYKITPEDKINKLSKNIDLISTFIDVLK